MTCEKLFLSAAAACLFGASFAVMAQQEPPVVATCDDGRIVATAVDEIRVDGRSCFVSEVFVAGDVTATNSRTFTITSSTVGGSIAITGSENATVLANDVFNGDVNVEQNTRAIVTANRIDSITAGVGGNVLVDQHDNALVDRNVVDGNITCTNNVDLDSFQNIAGGTEACP